MGSPAASRPPARPAHRRVYLLVAVAALVVDQATKAWARGALAGGPLPVLGDTVLFRLGLNPGIAFSFLRTSGQTGRVVLTAAAFLAGGIVTLYALRTRLASGALAAGLGLIAAGAIGNGVDRLVSGVVTDFIVLRAGAQEWPTFNVADAALAVGVALVLLGGKPGKSPAG